MPANIEIKARVRDSAALRRTATELAARSADHTHHRSGETIIDQEDTFFAARSGRLKLREFLSTEPDSPRRGELIHYSRPDVAGPKQSTYTISPTDDVPGLRAALAGALGVIGVVRKRRHLILVGQTRIHIDRVAGLGDFMELEIVLEEGQSVTEGERIADELMAALGIGPDDLVEGAYIDLLSATAAE